MVSPRRRFGSRIYWSRSRRVGIAHFGVRWPGIALDSSGLATRFFRIRKGWKESKAAPGCRTPNLKWDGLVLVREGFSHQRSVPARIVTACLQTVRHPLDRQNHTESRSITPIRGRGYLHGARP